MANSGGMLFLNAVRKRVDQTLDACTRCGKCVVACPMVEPAGLDTANANGNRRRCAGFARRRTRNARCRALGFGLHQQRQVHSRLRLWRRSALHGEHGPCGFESQARSRYGAPRRTSVLQHDEPRHARDFALAPFARGPRTTQPAIACRRRIRRDPGHRFLHRLQHHQDAAYRAAGARGARSAGRHLRSDGRCRDLLRHSAVQAGRRKDRGPGGIQYHRKACTPGRITRHFVVSELPDSDRRIRVAGLQGIGRRRAVRHEPDRGIFCRAAGRSAALVRASRAQTRRAAGTLRASRRHDRGQEGVVGNYKPGIFQ